MTLFPYPELKVLDTQNIRSFMHLSNTVEYVHMPDTKDD